MCHEEGKFYNLEGQSFKNIVSKSKLHIEKEIGFSMGTKYLGHQKRMNLLHT